MTPHIDLPTVICFSALGLVFIITAIGNAASAIIKAWRGEDKREREKKDAPKI